MKIEIKADEIMAKKNKLEREYAAINQTARKMYDNSEIQMPIMMGNEQLTVTYTFEPEVVIAVNNAGYAIVPNKKLFLRVIG